MPSGSPVVYIPMRLAPGFDSESEPVSILPGIALLLPGQQLEAFSKLIPVRLPFKPTCAVRIDADVYEAGAKERLSAGGTYVSSALPPLTLVDNTQVEHGMFAAGFAIRKWIMTALLLCKPFAFTVGPVLRRWTDPKTGRPHISTHSQARLEGTAHGRTASAPDQSAKKLDLSDLTALTTLTEEYFRVAPYRMDRIAVALSAFWTSYCTPYPEHAYLSASIVLEALLSTQEQEISHQLAERTALLLASDGHDAVSLYRSTKRLYATRSNIVHGRGMSKPDQARLRKRRKREEHAHPSDFSLYLHPLAHLVPWTELRELTELCVRLIRTALGDDKLHSLLRGDDDQAIDSWFLHLLMNAQVNDSAPGRASKPE